MTAVNSFLHTLLELDFDSATVYASAVGTATPSAFYEGRVLSLPPITRSIPIECGLYNVGQVEIRLSNHDGYLSQQKASEPWLNRTGRMLLGYPELGISTFERGYTGIISDPVFEDQIVGLSLVDDALGRFDGPITDVLQRVIPGGYPDAAPADSMGELIPFVYGYHQKPVDGIRDVGQLPARRINDTAFQYAAAHGSVTVDEVYVYGVLVSLGVDYTLDTFFATGGEVFTRINFTVDPRDLTNHTADEIEVTWNGIGIDTADGHSSNPLYQLKNFLANRFGVSLGEFDAANFTTNATAMDERGINGAWAIVDSRLSVVDVLGEFLTSYATRMYRTRDGLIAFSFLGTNAAAVEDFRESHEIIDGTFKVTMNPKDSTASRLQINFDWNYVRQFYGRQPDLNSPSEESNLRYPKRRNKSLRYVRTLNQQIDTAVAIGSLYMALMTEGLQLVEFDVPASFFSSIDLGDVVTVTHSKGIGVSGYVAKRVIVLETQLNASPDVERLHIRGYAAQEPSIDLSATFNLVGGLEVLLEAA